ncbi:MAG: InlB B-repeat-containing protein, partial [Candidatus Gracilibacteria bacterium]|nr:InlB B-repeat-containing protein [Candidatus Gracilibacteria bacterium]
IAFTQMGSFQKDARDSKRITNISTIAGAFDINMAAGKLINTSETSTEYNIVITGSTFTMTGYYGQINNKLLDSLKVYSKDITTTTDYPYSYSYFPTEKKYQVSSFLENSSNLPTTAHFIDRIINQTYADTTSTGYAYIKGNFSATGGINSLIPDTTAWTNAIGTPKVIFGSDTVVLGTSTSAPTPANGVCGSANTAPVSVAPTTDLCTTGNSTLVTTNIGDYTWNCEGINAGTAMNCTAPRQYTVNFDGNGGTTVSSINANYNTTITAPTPPTKTGYTFAGWYKDAGLTTAWNFTTDTVTVATTLYAKWIITTFTLSSSSVTSGTPITISHNCITPPTSYTSSNTAVATISATTITSLAAGTTNITPIGGNCNDSVTKVLVVTAPQYPGCSIPDIPVGGKYWAACNVGASQPSTAYVASANDSTIGTETTNGKYFQWGENVAWDYDGGVTSTDNCTWNRDTQACGASALGAWSATVSDVTSGGVDRWNDWSTTDTRGPCAPNYHVPTQTEWNIVYTTLGSTRNTLASTLKLPMAGSRYYTDGSLVVQSFYASYWSSSPDTTNAYYLDFTTTAAYLDFSYGRARSFSVRCLKN